MSGEEAPTRFDAAIYSAMKLNEEKRFESLKILFFGEGSERSRGRVLGVNGQEKTDESLNALTPKILRFL